MSKNKSNGTEEKFAPFMLVAMLMRLWALLVIGLGITIRVTVQGILQKVYWIANWLPIKIN